MVKILGLQTYNGTQRKAQEKFIKRFLEYELTNNKRNQIVITKIHSPPLPKNFFRKLRKFEFQEEFEIILHNLLISSNGKYVNSKMRLYRDCHCFSEETLKIIKCDKANDNVAYNKALKIFKVELLDICNKKAIYRLKRYHSEGKISLSKVYTAFDLENNTNCIISENDDKYLLINQIESEVMKEMHCDNIFHIIKNGLVSEYYKNRKFTIIEKLNLTEVYSKINIKLQDFDIKYSNKDLCHAYSVWNKYIKDLMIKRITSRKSNALNNLKVYTKNVIDFFDINTTDSITQSIIKLEELCDISNCNKYNQLKENIISSKEFDILLSLINTL